MICLDTYELVEIHEGNPDTIHLQQHEFVIPDLIMAEFYGILLKRLNQKTADYWARKYEPFVETTGLHIQLEAVRIRQQHRKLSIFDCVGYVFAKTHKIPFVTGDKELLELDGVKHHTEIS